MMRRINKKEDMIKFNQSVRFNSGVMHHDEDDDQYIYFIISWETMPPRQMFKWFQNQKQFLI